MAMEPIFLAGTVTDETDGQPITGAAVTVLQNGTEAGRGLSDEKGTYFIALAADGTCRVSAQAEGYADFEDDASVSGPTKYDIAMTAQTVAAVITVYVGYLERDDMGTRPMPGGGLPTELSNMHLLRDPEGDNERITPDAFDSSQGLYTFRDLPAGTYALPFSAALGVPGYISGMYRFFAPDTAEPLDYENTPVPAANGDVIELLLELGIPA